MPNKDILILAIIGVLIVIMLSIAILVFFVIFQRRQLKHRLEKQALHSSFQQELLKTQLEIQEQTFQNISQEIHDNIGQVLTLAKLTLNTVEQNLPPVTAEKIQRSKELVAKTISDLRDLSKSLNTEMIKEVGLHEIIEREITLISKTCQYKTAFNLDGQPFRFDKQKELIIFRIFQELINNIMKHSKAKTVIVRLLYQPCLFNLTVSDDGQGFEATGQHQAKGHFGLGIRNINNRATLIGGNFQLISIPGEGTTVSIDLPLEKNYGSV